MANYIVRVELHGASGSDYTNLHTAMSNAGFSRYIVSGDGKTYQLPTGEYVGSSTLGINHVRDTAYNVASNIRQNPSVIAAEYTNASWKGLTQV